MIKVHKFNFGDYFQKIIMDEKKIKDTECTCKWGEIHKKAWKNDETICKHIHNAIIHLNRGLKKYGNKLKEKESTM